MRSLQSPYLYNRRSLEPFASANPLGDLHLITRPARNVQLPTIISTISHDSWDQLHIPPFLLITGFSLGFAPVAYPARIFTCQR